MSTISITVSPALANLYEQANENEKRKAEQYINSWLSSFFFVILLMIAFFEIMKQASEIAKKNGLTPEKPDQLI